ncbi:MAG: pheA operon leader peptide PheL [Enterobacteriaceae bacterium]|nr:pheA operon leader peptide PheL [Enterobacteriaceae bacterium]
MKHVPFFFSFFFTFP